MRVLHFSSAQTWRGGEQQIAYLFEELEKLGVQQWIFCRKGSALAEHCLFQNWPHFTYWKGFSINPFIGFQLKKLCTQLNVDLVHLHDSHSHTFAYMSALVGNQTPYILSRRVDFPVKNSILSRKKYNHSSIKKIISVSHKVQAILAPAIKDATKLNVVHSGIDLSKFKYESTGILRKEFGIPDTTSIIANVAAIAPHKDYFTFVDTAAILLEKQTNLHFFIIGGDGGEATAIQTYIEKKGLQSFITSIGFRKDIPKILPEVDVFLFTSKEEGLGTSVLDALACKVPIVATNAGGIPEMITPQKNGLLAPIGDSLQLAKHVTTILSKKEIANNFIENGAVVVQSFDKAKTAKKTYDIYRNCLSTL